MKQPDLIRVCILPTAAIDAMCRAAIDFYFDLEAAAIGLWYRDVPLPFAALSDHAEPPTRNFDDNLARGIPRQASAASSDKA